MMLQKGLRDIIDLLDGNHVLICTDLTIDNGWETMVFRCDQDGMPLSFADLDVAHSDENGWEKMHEEMCEIWRGKEKLPDVDQWGFPV